MRSNKTTIILFLSAVFLLTSACFSIAAEVGTFYFPGWNSATTYWNDIKGLPGSRSPGKSWPDREPLLGFYPEEQQWVTEKHIDWASSYGIDFFVYDWYWNGSSTYLDHAIKGHINSKNKQKMKLALLWANHSANPTSVADFTAMVEYWIQSYFKDPQYYRIDNKPVVFVFSPQQLRDSAANFGKSSLDLLTLARNIAKTKGLPGIYFVGSSAASSAWINDYLPNNGYDAISAYNYHNKAFTGQYTGKEPLATDYSQLTDGYKSQWQWILQNSTLPYFVPISAGWDKRPWGSNTTHDSCNSTPVSFKAMLTEAKKALDAYPEKSKGICLIYSWNEFGEGGYIEPTKKWKFQYLQAIKDVFRK
jgi:hypothetical protein